jgi:hypothetical protein
MLARREKTTGRRRGVVLILILGMLGLMALIGVTFAAFAGQAQVGSRNFAAGVASANAEQMMDYALAQLINDTNNPLSALRGHSLGRDMYGNDSVMRNSGGQNNSTVKNYMAALPDGSPMFFTGVGTYPTSGPNPTLFGRDQFTTNIPTGYSLPQLYGLNFSNWSVSISDPAGGAVTQILEVLEDDSRGAFHVLTLSASDDPFNTSKNAVHPVPGLSSGTAANVPATSIFHNLSNINNSNNAIQDTPPKRQSTTAPIWPYQPNTVELVHTKTNATTANISARIILDGRRIRAFNGPGVSAQSRTWNDGTLDHEFVAGLYPNYRINGGILGTATLAGNVSAGGNPDSIGLDEDYDACDLENWFLAIQSADGKVVVPSFHRPGIIRVDLNTPSQGDDWQLRNVESAARFLRPRLIDHPRSGLRNLYPDSNGQITYDVDNDGDGTTDSVWLDLGFPPSRDLSGRLSKPLFAFLVLGLNGRMPLNTVGNLQGRDVAAYEATNAGAALRFPANLPSFDHVSHLGYSPSEINPKFALQVPAPYDPTSAPVLAGLNYSAADNATDPGANALQHVTFPTPTSAPIIYRGVPVWLTQLRNLLAGTRPHKDPQAPDFDVNYDKNFVYFHGAPYAMPNGLLDSSDRLDPTSGTVIRNSPSVAGRWGEGGYVPSTLKNNLTDSAGDPISTLRWIFPAAVNTKVWPADPLVRFPLMQLNWINPIRAGKSSIPGVPDATDSTDDNFTAWDPYPRYIAPKKADEPPQATPEYYNFLDNTGSLSFASERMRRFLTPVDVSGSGRVLRFDAEAPAQMGLIAGPGNDANWGADSFGRVGFFNYFRPPGLPGYETANVNSPTYATHPPFPAPPPYTVGYATWVAPPGVTDMTDTTANGLGWPVANVVSRATNLNVTGGYESKRLPGGRNQKAMGSMPYNNTSPIQTPFNATTPQALTFLADDLGMSYVSTAPTIEMLLNPTAPANNYNVPAPAASYPMGSAALPAGPNPRMNRLEYPMGGLGRDEADEMNLYSPTSTDAPYSVSDLEWLYRLHDIDGNSLTSRLAKLAPLSFTNPDDGLSRRRLFSIETWDLNHPAWAPDNPVNTITGLAPLTVGSSLYAENSSFAYNANASVANYASIHSPVAPVNVDDRTTKVITTGGSLYPAAETPSVAYLGKKINLNFPLPISNDPDEPVRKKWIRETYEYVKLVLPPRAVDTPEELAELSQYLTNLIDFRDTDGASTHFVNEDLGLVPPTNTSPPRVVFRTDATTHVTFEQYGMEYNPIALNEVLAYRYKGRIADNPKDVTRFFIEVVNTLVDPNGGNNDSDLKLRDDLKGWSLLVLPDDVLGRPNPVNGQLSFDPATTVAGKEVLPVPLSILTKDSAGAGIPSPIPALRNTTTNSDVGIAGVPYYYVISNQDPAGTTVANVSINDPNADPANPVAEAFLPPPPGASPNQDLVAQLELAYDQTAYVASGPSAAPLGISESRFKWLYLLRPCNPFDPNSAPVVADCVRFSFTDTGGTTGDVAVAGEMMPITTQRLQPYRGGQLISPIGPTAGAAPAATGLTPYSPPDAYGYSEQTAPPNDAADTRRGPAGQSGTPAVRETFGVYAKPGEALLPNKKITKSIFSTIGTGNIPADNIWDQLHFLDRDFQSVAEVLMVPVTPPGLFTKKFVENAPPAIYTFPIPYAITQDPPSPTVPPRQIADVKSVALPFPVRTNDGDLTRSKIVARTYPYLSDKFYYSGQTDATHPGINWLIARRRDFGTQGGWTSAGWHKMLEFFDVPSPAMGSIGLVQGGANFDWAREDLKPGLLNLNLIIDQEVFLGLFDSPSLELAKASATGLHPKIVNQVGVLNYPNRVADMTSRPFYYPNNDDTVHFQGSVIPNFPTYGSSPDDGMTAAFADFLKLRHGGSGFLFAYGKGNVGSGPAPSIAIPAPVIVPANADVASERPFHALSYPDINYTIMRPATLPPNLLHTTPALNLRQPVVNPPPAAAAYYAGDPGVKNPWLTPAMLPPNPAGYTPYLTPLTDGAGVTSLVPDGNEHPTPGATNPLGTISTIAPTTVPLRNGAYNATTDPPYNIPQPPPIPPRRLMAISDAPNSVAMSAAANKFPVTVAPNPTNMPTPPLYNSNAAQGYDLVLGDNGQPEVNHPVKQPNLSNAFGNLFNPGLSGNRFARFLGGADDTDRRQHPYFRTEILQKVMNLTTVRTHQFAVWITVGFFQVVRQGNATYINTALGVHQPQPDELGVEIDLELGKNRRFRSFFVLDRTRLNGFNPSNPQDFRDVVTYRRRIE